MLRVFLDEEYGYISSMWLYPFDKECLIDCFNSGQLPVLPMGSGFRTEPEFYGTVKKLNCKETRALHKDGRVWERVDAYLHVHENEDTSLAFGPGEYYSWSQGTEPDRNESS